MPLKKIDRFLTIVLGIIGGRFVEPFIIPLIGVRMKLQYSYVRYSSKIIVCIGFILFYGIFSCYYYNYTWGKLLQQSTVLLVLFLSYNVIFKSLSEGELKKLYDKYLEAAYYVSALGLIQFFVYFVFKYNIFSFINSVNDIRISSVLLEPGYLGQFLIPAVASILLSSNYNKNEKEKRRAVIIMVCYFLTFSSIAYFIAFFIMLMKFYKSYKSLALKIISVIISLLMGFYMWNVMEQYYNLRDTSTLGQINMKIIETKKIFEMQSTDEFTTLNLSSFALASNLHVARNAPNRILGTGLGSHEANYQRIYGKRFFDMTLNSTDGYSLLIRILSEFGYLGLVIYLIWFFRHLNLHNEINVAVFFGLLSFMLRGGHYFIYGIVFFHFFYYYTSQNKKFF